LKYKVFHNKSKKNQFFKKSKNPDKNPLTMKLITFYFALLFSSSVVMNLHAQQIAIGQWRDELPYALCNSVTDADDRVYSSTPYAVLSVIKEDHSVTRITKINGLSDIGISCINYNKTNQTLVIAYTNANIDLIKNNIIINISDIKRKTILGNKTINSIYFIGTDAFLSCGFGIVVLDLEKEEIKDTYYIGKDGSQVNVLGIIKDNKDSLFAATEKGIYRAYYKDPNLANFANWRKDVRLDTNAMYSTITYFAEKVMVNKRKSPLPDTLFTYNNGIWTKWDEGIYDPVVKLESNSSYLIISYQYYIRIYDPDFSFIYQIYGYEPGTPIPLDAVPDKNNFVWIADAYSGLIAFDMKQNLFDHYNLSGPLTSQAFSLTTKDNDLYIAPGSHDGSYSPRFVEARIYQFDNTNWYNYQGANNPPLYGFHDIVTIAVDPFDSKRFYAGTWGSGLLEFYNGSFVIQYNEKNSTLNHHSASPDSSDIRVGGTVFDPDGILWVVNSHNNNALSMKNGDSWTGFNIPAVNEADLGQLMIDTYGQKWIQMRYDNLNAYSILVFTDNGTPANTGDDQAKKLNSTVGNGNIPGNTVFAMATDKNGEVWVGTEKGVAVFYSPENIFTGQNFDAQRILVEQDGYVQYLLENETVTSIAVDGANRKWIGTDRGGVFLFSEDGTKQIYHFTEENSPLLSNRLTSIAINNITGEVYFGTDKGVISFKSTATEGGETFGDVYAYPNPVREGYDGYIAIKGLVNNAQVKITDISGTLVYTAKAEGGQAVWDGNNLNGKRARTGVYLVFAATENGSEKIVTKILIIN